MNKNTYGNEESYLEIKKIEAAIEAILFTMGNAVPLEQLAKAVEQDAKTTEKIIHNLMDRYRQEDGGLQIIELDRAYQMLSLIHI